MFGFIKLAAAIPQVTVANCTLNAQHIISLLQKADEQRVGVVCFPELSITGATCNDLFFQRPLIEAVNQALHNIVEATSTLTTFAIVGAPLLYKQQLYNCAIVIGKGKVWGVVPKTYLANHAEASETRWFTSGATLAPEAHIQIDEAQVPFSAQQIFTTPDFTFGIAFGNDVLAPLSTSTSLSLAGADVIFTPSAFPESAGHHAMLRSSLLNQSKKDICAIICASAGYGESTQDLVLSGKTFITEKG